MDVVERKEEQRETHDPSIETKKYRGSGSHALIASCVRYVVVARDDMTCMHVYVITID